MKTVQLSQLGALADDVRKGEEIEIVDGEKALAKVTPVRPLSADAWKHGSGTVPDWFLEELPPKFPESVLEQLLHDRRSRDW